MIIAAASDSGLGLPTWQQLTTGFGPYLGTLIFFITIVIFLQWYWYRANIKSKNEEIARSQQRVVDLERLNNDYVKQLIEKK